MTFDKQIDTYFDGARLLRAAVAGMPRELLTVRPVAGKWSTLEVLCHLADFEIVYADRMKRVIAEQEPTLFGGNPDVFAARLGYQDRKAEEELRVVEVVRAQMARILHGLSPADFQRQGRHSERGLLTLETLLSQITAHIPHHLRFIEEKRRVLE
jgi:hypothetical protein